mmetsp:Transcript_15420/g.48205  ORF Transcript_15420/g.48205 Transcript_15420/m.48205 type:complete len:403 (+) Transcript_15420:489-1697(+)
MSEWSTPTDRSERTRFVTHAVPASFAYVSTSSGRSPGPATHARAATAASSSPCASRSPPWWSPSPPQLSHRREPLRPSGVDPQNASPALPTPRHGGAASADSVAAGPPLLRLEELRARPRSEATCARLTGAAKERAVGRSTRWAASASAKLSRAVALASMAGTRVQTCLPSPPSPPQPDSAGPPPLRLSLASHPFRQQRSVPQCSHAPFLLQRRKQRSPRNLRVLPWTMTDLASASASASVPRDAANCAPTRSEDSVRRRLSSCLCAAAALAHAPPLDEPALLHASAASSSSSCGSQASHNRRSSSAAPTRPPPPPPLPLAPPQQPLVAPLGEHNTSLNEAILQRKAQGLRRGAWRKSAGGTPEKAQGARLGGGAMGEAIASALHRRRAAVVEEGDEGEWSE